jgi:F-type H+-transporting ATPase subunit b
MNFIFLSFFLTSEEVFLEFNTNILETNLINILILIGVLLYVYKTSLSSTLENRQKEIIQIIENAQKDVTNASTYFFLAEKGFMQSLFCLQSWKLLYEKEKIDIVTIKYLGIKKGLKENFSTTENILKNFEKKAFTSLQRYLILITASKILRKFFFLSEKEQSKLIEVTISKLGERNKENES